MPLAFNDWKQRLLDAAGCASPAVRQLGDFVLELFWKDGCEPTVSAMLDYAQAGLCGHFNIQVEGRRISAKRRTQEAATATISLPEGP